MRIRSQTCGSATEAAKLAPTDWATLGARILAAASQAARIHLVETARRKAGRLGRLDVDRVVEPEPESQA